MEVNPCFVGRVILQVESHLNLVGWVTKCQRALAGIGDNQRGNQSLFSVCHSQPRQTGKDYLKQIEISKTLTLTGVAQWIDCQPANQRVTGSIPS